MTQEERINESDVVVSVTNNDEKNLLCSLLAKQMGVAKVITRVSKIANVRLFEKVGIDVAISENSTAIDIIENQLIKTDIEILATVERGQGEILEEITLPKLNIAILYQDGLEVSSRDAYKTYDRIGEEDVEKSNFLTKGECFNALEKSAVALCKGIRTNLDVMKYAGFDSYTITGSGSAVIGLCKSRLALADALAKARLLIGDSRKTLISFTK